MVGLDFRFRGNDGWWGWISACAGNDGVFFRVLGYGSMNSRARGNDGWWGWIPLSNDGWWGWISACAGNE